MRRTSIDEYADLGLQDTADGVEQPSMRVNLLLVLRLEDKDDLHRHQVVGVFSMGEDECWCGVDRDLCCVLKDVGNGLLGIDL